MSDEMIRVGVIGAGANTTSRHIPGLQAIEGVEIVTVCNRSRESSERVAGQFNIPQTCETWLDVIEDPDLDAIVIGTWPYLHYTLVMAALEADKHVMCEARMAMNATEAHLMHEAALARPHLVAQIVPSPFSLRVDKTIKRLIAEGYLGDILAVEVRDRSGFLDTQAPLHWRHNFDLSGYNVMTMGIWYEAIMRWVGEATRVVALGKTFVKLRRDPQTNSLQSVRIPEHIDVLADLACGAQAHISVSRAMGLAGPTEAYLFGSKGTLRFVENKLYGGQAGDNSLQEIPIPAEEAGGWRVEEEFVNAIRGKEPITHTTLADGVKYMEFTEAVAISMAEGEAVSLPL